MHELQTLPTDNKPTAYRELRHQLEALLAGGRDWIANFANTAALLYHSLPDLNWAGFYLFKNDELVLGPFQGKPACVRIAMGRGVCGTAAARRETVIVPNVHAFAGHIACDTVWNSEIVVPMIGGTTVLGVLDLNSPKLDRFDDADRAGLEAIVRSLLQACA